MQNMESQQWCCLPREQAAAGASFASDPARFGSTLASGLEQLALLLGNFKSVVQADFDDWETAVL